MQATADAAYDYLVSTRGVEPDRIIAAGWSLGGAVAIDLASRRQVGGLIAFSSFTSLGDMARRILPFVPVSLLLRHRFDSVSKIAKIGCPDLDRPRPPRQAGSVRDGAKAGQASGRSGHDALD